MSKARQLGRGICGFLAIQVVIGLGLVPSAAQSADAVEHLYEVSLLAIDQSDGARQKSLREGLEKVIVRISGQTDWQGNSVIQEAMATPDAYLQQFSYVSLTDTEIADIKVQAELKNRFESKSGKDKRLLELLPGIRINASFAPESIKALLRRAQLPLWPSKRPSVLVWVVVDSGNGKQVLGQSSAGQAFLLQESARRGLPIVMPMNDLNDQVILGTNRLWDLDQAAIMEASQRYGEDSVLVGRVAQLSPGQWQGNWLYLLKGQSQLIESSADDLEDFLASGIHAAVQAQVQRYGISPTSTASKVLLDISGVDSLKRYAEVLEFLKSLDLVTSLAITEVKDTELRCLLDIEGDARLLQESISLSEILVSDEAPLSESSAMPGQTASDAPRILHYHFMAL